MGMTHLQGHPADRHGAQDRRVAISGTRHSNIGVRAYAPPIFGHQLDEATDAFDGIDVPTQTSDAVTRELIVPELVCSSISCLSG